MLNSIDSAGICWLRPIPAISISWPRAFCVKTSATCWRVISPEPRTSPSRYDIIFSMWDLPEPKNPEIHTPFDWGRGAFHSSRIRSRPARISEVITYSSTSERMWADSSALITPSIVRLMSLA